MLSLIIVSTPSLSLAESSTSFTDISGHWAEPQLMLAYQNGLMQGSNNQIFPNSALTRGELATILSRAFNYKDSADISAFTDVPSTEWYADGIAKSVAYGLLNGTSSTTMSPKDNVSRQEVFTIMYRALALTPINNITLNFKDSADIADYALEPISTMVALDYAKGNLGYLRPLDNMSRAEFATLMNRIIGQYITQPDMYTQTDIIMGSVMIKCPGVTLTNITIYGDLFIAPDAQPDLKNVTINGRKIQIANSKNAEKLPNVKN